MNGTHMLMRRTSLAVLFATALAAGGCARIVTSGGEDAHRFFAAAHDNPAALRIFLKDFPKGADLHSHLSGAVWAESYIDWAAHDGLCVDVHALALAPPPCDGKDKVAASDHGAIDPLRAKLVRSLSTAGYLDDEHNGHDQFFSAFSRFNSASRGRVADMLAEVTMRAAGQGVLHLESMITFNPAWARAIPADVWSDDWDAMRTALRSKGLERAVTEARREADLVGDGARAVMGCGGSAPDPGCDVSLLWIQQVNRGAPKHSVFAQMQLAFELAAADPRVAGMNIVGPEDGREALADYDLHMRMVGYFHRLYPNVRIALHAGELAFGQTPPAALRNHIRKAVEIGGAQRIGHGVDLPYEDDPFGLLREMAARKVPVEINLTSNDLILGVRGKAHPLSLYRRFGVPVALSTDDEGVERTDLTQEYRRAVEEQGLSYDDLKRASRNSLEYSFLPGPSLWADSERFIAVWSCRALSSPTCAEWAMVSPKARRQIALERLFLDFEARTWPDLGDGE